VLNIFFYFSYNGIKLGDTERMKLTTHLAQYICINFIYLIFFNATYLSNASQTYLL